ncbi:extracellular solute-binding protein [Candidatus Kaiserbacteria bacterium]|nr:extracellular solute-binding protein [Candidatus Kaiserbacteria bacterium]
MKISLFQGIILGVFGLAALIGLFVFATYTSTGGNATVGNVVIWGTLPKEGINAALATAAKTEPGLKSVSYVQMDEATLASNLASAIATGASPDLVLASQEDLASLAKFITPTPLATLSARTFASTFAGGAQIFAAPADAGYYGIPLLIDPLALFYNRTILSSSGVAAPPATWEAVTGLVPGVTTLTPARQITRSLIGMGTYSNVHNARGILSALFLQTGVPISTRSGSGVMSANLGESSGGGVPPGQAVLRFYTQFADPSKVSYTWNASLKDSQTAFLAGDLALYLGYASEARYLREANPNLDFDVARLPQPATASVKRAYGLIYALMISRGAKNPSGAYSAAALLTNSAEQSAAASATGLAPAVVGELASAPANDPIAAVAYAEALYARGWLSPAPAETDRVFSGMITDVISGRLTLDAALTLAERSLASLLQP